METFFILLLIIFVPFVWFIYRMLRYTDDTVGENSPLQRERTYWFSASQYFFTFTKVLEAFLLVMMLIVAFIAINAGIHQKQYFGLLLAPFFLAFSGYLGFYFYFDWQYWTITRNVQLTLNPFDPSIHIDSPTQLATLTPENVARIESHLRKSDNPKEPLYGYGYLLFHRTDGTVVWVNNIFFQDFIFDEFMERFFRGKPVTTIYHRIPWVTDFQYAEK